MGCYKPDNMIQKWRDYFTDECDTCGGDLTKDGVVYIINNVQGICADCYESVSIFLIDMDIDIKKKEKQ